MELHKWINEPALNEWYYSFKDADGLEWTINLVPWYESQESPWEASVVSEKRLIGLHFPSRYLDDDIDQLKADAIRRVAGLFPDVEFPEKCLNSQHMTQFIADEAHFKEVIERVSQVKRSLWIGTADIKDLYVEDRPFLGVLADLIKKGREVRLIHAKEPELVEAAMNQFDSVWAGFKCKNCGRKEYCGDPILK